MGEVYRAKDTKLARDVALKILPESFIHDVDRVARFRREAQLLASLNHPNIAAIYGFEERDGVRALVLELVDGPTLADRIVHGAIPIEEALPIARQIADALEAAHEQGVVHRDLKPANIKLRPDGRVKVLDFGLAKAMEPVGSGARTNVTASPTITTPAVTEMGAILGTAAYMSPEQARGRAADKRSDVWAFGCVLYEMLAGRQAFPGDSAADHIGAILHKEPDWTALPSISSELRHLLVRCLEKNPNRRLHDIADARIELEENSIGAGHSAIETHPTVKRNMTAIVTAAILGTVVALVAILWMSRPHQSSPLPVSRWTIQLPQAITLSTNAPVSAVALSPDGRTIVFTGERRHAAHLATLPASDRSASGDAHSGNGGRKKSLFLT
jgi:serine/threonine protein kinase